MENVETAEGGSAVAETKGRLMWRSEANTLINNSCSNIVYRPLGGNIRYWLGTPNNSTLRDVYMIYDGTVDYWSSNDNKLSLRPSTSNKSFSI